MSDPIQSGVNRDPEQVHILQHSLGLDRECREPWRNHYCDADGAPKLEALVALGLMRRGHTINSGEDRIYHVTEAGTAVAIAALPKPLSASKRRYRRYLSALDAGYAMTFMEFLKRENR